MTTSVGELIEPSAIISDAEVKRLANVRRYDILDTPPDGSFDRITALAAKLFSVPISIISLVDHDRIWFKSHHGLDVQQIGRDPGLCASAILQDEPFLLTDAKIDPRSLANPLVAGDFGLRFYLGVPLKTSDGFNLGTLCVIDREPKAITESQIADLKDLASVVMDQMELRLSARRAISDLSQVVEQKDAALRRAELMAKEIDHRVMNSLQLTSALLRLQGRGLGDSDASEQLTLAANRVSAIARVHQHIYMSESVASIECKGYLARLCDDLSGILRSADEPIRVEGIEAEISTAQIVPLGLIVNELVTNAAKHGAGKITVLLQQRQPAGYALSVCDEGPGLPAGFEPKTTRSLGMRVVRSLVQQLGGELLAETTEGRQGAKVTVLFPALAGQKSH
jgi:two-component sensor histidine kinase